MITKQAKRAIRKSLSHFAEAECRRILEEDGWRVHYAGFLDYICEKDNLLIIVEVKSHQRVNERHDQNALMLKIANLGIPCFIYRPDVGFQNVPSNARSDALGGLQERKGGELINSPPGPS